MVKRANARIISRGGEDFLTVAQAIDESGFSEDTIRRHIAKGALPVVRVGPSKRVQIRRRDFDRYLEA